MGKTWVLASNNLGKIREIQTVLAPYDITLRPQKDFGVPEAEETGSTYVENAIIKARHATTLTGLPSLADDSGLAVDALCGAPGIISARYAGLQANDDDNIDKLLEELQTIPDGDRTAHYYCVLVVMQSAADAMPWYCEGTWSGEILHQRRGIQGFGYDPIFKIAGRDETAAECDAALKNQLSHRGQALQQLVRRFTELTTKT